MNLQEIYNKDLFGRKKIIRTLMEYIRSYENECKVISIHSPWGTGKTTFLEMWVYYLTLEEGMKNKYYPIYFNAWENDDSKNPLMSILIELNELPEFKESTESKVLTTIASVLSTKAPKFFFKALLGFLPLDEKIKTEINIFLSSLIDDGMTLDTIKEAFKDKDKLEIYSEKFSDFNVELIRKKIKKLFIKNLENFQQKTDKRIIFFVDELDRCRPTFAIETLETIKHLFSVKNYNFVLAWDLEQLSYSIATIYGNNMDTGGYLRRFVDLEYSLPEVNKGNYINNLMNSEIHNLFLVILKAFDFSLRDLEKITNIIKINDGFSNFYFNSSTLEGQYLYILGYLFFSLKYKNPVLHIKLKNKTLTENEKIALVKILEETSRIALDSYNNRVSDNYKIPLISYDNFLVLISKLVSTTTLRQKVEIEISPQVKIDVASLVNSNGINKLLDISLYF